VKAEGVMQRCDPAQWPGIAVWEVEWGAAEVQTFSSIGKPGPVSHETGYHLRENVTGPLSRWIQLPGTVARGKPRSSKPWAAKVC
jgi:hypothetical protein